MRGSPANAEHHGGGIVVGVGEGLVPTDAQPQRPASVLQCMPIDALDLGDRVRWSPAVYLAGEAPDENQVKVTACPSKAASPSHALKLRGTEGPAIRNRSAGPRSDRAARISSAYWSASVFVAAGSTSRYGSSDSWSCPVAADMTGSAPSRGTTRNTTLPRAPGSSMTSASASYGTNRSPSSMLSFDALPGSGVMRSPPSSNSHAQPRPFSTSPMQARIGARTLAAAQTGGHRDERPPPAPARAPRCQQNARDPSGRTGTRRSQCT